MRLRSNLGQEAARTESFKRQITWWWLLVHVLRTFGVQLLYRRELTELGVHLHTKQFVQNEEMDDVEPYCSLAGTSARNKLRVRQKWRKMRRNQATDRNSKFDRVSKYDMR